jgi:hypothetical protein
MAATEQGWPLSNTITKERQAQIICSVHKIEIYFYHVFFLTFSNRTANDNSNVLQFNLYL